MFEQIVSQIDFAPLKAALLQVATLLAVQYVVLAGVKILLSMLQDKIDDYEYYHSEEGYRDRGHT